MLITQTAFSALHSVDPTMSAGQAIARANRLLCSSIQTRLGGNKYVTAEVLVHRGDGVFERAGSHEWPIVWRSRTRRCEHIESHGPWLGIVPELPEIPVSTLRLEDGDILCLYTDGMIQTMNAAGEQFDVKRLMAVFEDSAGRDSPLERIVDDMMAAVGRFGDRQDDDRTLLLIRRRRRV
jgi:sigma-B regulation protein RsbU (phosphoserine phosphatase)